MKTEEENEAGKVMEKPNSLSAYLRSKTARRTLLTGVLIVQLIFPNDKSNRLLDRRTSALFPPFAGDNHR
jgi:hypothetical protein